MALIGISPWWLVRPAVLDIATRELLAAMSIQPDAHHVQVYDSTIRGLKAAGIWGDLDEFRWLAAHDEQASRLNWITPGIDTFSVVGSPVFTVDQGWQDSAESGYLRAEGPLMHAGSKAQRNNASFWVWINSEIDVGAVNKYEAGGANAGGGDGGANVNTFTYSARNGRSAVAINSNTISVSFPVTTSKGMTGGSRVAASEVRVFRNGTLQATDPIASTGITESWWSVCARLGLFNSPQQVSLVVSGASLSGKEAQLFSIVKSGMNALGVYE